MLVDETDSLPVVGNHARMLGVRVPPSDPADIRPDAEGRVRPRSGGLSVIADDPMKLPRHLRPERLKGGMAPGRGEVFVVDADAVVPPVAIRPDAPPHHLLEPHGPMPVAEFQAALSATRTHWRIPS